MPDPFVVPQPSPVQVDVMAARDRARHRYDRDAEFHYRVKALHQVLSLALMDTPSQPMIATMLELDDQLRRESGLR